MQPTAVENFHCCLEATAFHTTNDVFRRDTNILQIDITGLRAALSHLMVRLTNGEAG
ncbi:hypothetical protein D3C80_2212760 [compost metagenome]